MFRYSTFSILVALAIGWCATCVEVAAAADPSAEVAYRLTTQRSMHLRDQQAARQYEQTLRQLGCEVQASGHDGHIDLSYRCRDWRKATFADHTSAHKWQDWLAALGFEVQHQH